MERRDLMVWGFLCMTVLLIYWYIRYLVRSLKLKNVDRRHVLITGCDSGFGYLLALRLDKLGLSVFAGCLTEEGVKRIQKETTSLVSPILLDVTNTESIANAVKIVSDRISPDGTGLWALINNAGIAGPTLCPVEWLMNNDLHRTLSVNLFGMIETTRQFLPLLRLGKGRIVNMSSACGSTTLPFFLPYTISKYGVEVFSDSLRPEARKYGVSVHIIKPGMFETNITNKSLILDELNSTHSRLTPNVQEIYPKEFVLKLEKLIKRAPAASTDLHKVVDAYVHAITAIYPQYRYYVGWDAKTMWWILGFLPEYMTDFIYYKLSPSPVTKKL